MSEAEDQVEREESGSEEEQDQEEENTVVVSEEIFKVVQQVWKWMKSNLALVESLPEDAQQLPIYPPKKVMNMWPVLLAMVSEMNFTDSETISKKCFEMLLSTLTLNTDITMPEYGVGANWTAIKTFLGNLKRATHGSDLSSRLKTETTSTLFTTVPMRTAVAGASALDQLDENVNDTSYASSRKKASVPSSITTSRKDPKNVSILKCEFTQDPNILVEVYITNLLKVNSEDLYTDKMWKYRTQSVKLYLNDMDPDQNQIATHFVQLAKASRETVAKRKREEDESEIHSQKESRDPDSSRSVKKSKRN